jgi:hypothetical protein
MKKQIIWTDKDVINNIKSKIESMKLLVQDVVNEYNELQPELPELSKPDLLPLVQDPDSFIRESINKKVSGAVETPMIGGFAIKSNLVADMVETPDLTTLKGKIGEMREFKYKGHKKLELGLVQYLSVENGSVVLDNDAIAEMERTYTIELEGKMLTAFNKLESLIKSINATNKHFEKNLGFRLCAVNGRGIQTWLAANSDLTEVTVSMNRIYQFQQGYFNPTIYTINDMKPATVRKIEKQETKKETEPAGKLGIKPETLEGLSLDQMLALAIDRGIEIKKGIIKDENKVREYLTGLL